MGTELRVRERVAPAVLANALAFAVLIYAAILNAVSPDGYYRAVQEDEWLEWATFWAFIAAAGVFFVTARKWRRSTGQSGWFLFLVGVFCWAVAMEEISWGQRLLGFTPPDYFLENNYQQELNLHNVFSSMLRMMALRIAVLGYGLVLPLLGLVPALKGRLNRFGLRGAPLQMIPAFVATYAMVEAYPWKYSGEIAELMFGLSLLAGGFLTLSSLPPTPDSKTSAKRVQPLLALALSAFLVFLLGVGSSNWLRGWRADDAAAVQAAERELAALEADFRTIVERNGNNLITKCGLHKRLQTFVTEYKVSGLKSGTFARMADSGMSRSRAEYFLDPWNLPYWLKDKCDRDGRRHIFVYSFGPNRRRDSSDWGLQPDDVGVYLLREDP